MAEHTETPWCYRPFEHDDWGFIRDLNGNLVAIAREGTPLDSASLDEHRRNKTDPCGPYAERIVKAVNRDHHFDALVKALTEARLQLEYVQEKHGYATGETVLARVRAALAAVTTPSEHGGEK